MWYLSSVVFNTPPSVGLEEKHQQDSIETVCDTNHLRVPLWGKGYDISEHEVRLKVMEKMALGS